ncbi:hypothetical protein [Nonomuraea longicatena]|uniref:Secreted protein n=1 Tax=Nonomuraea longicatena TaxID=83682 RepID=A0ABN1NR88_9ACTN
MLRRLAGVLVIASATLVAAPIAANASTAETAKRDPIRVKIYDTRCEDTCVIKARFKNVTSRKLWDVRMVAKLRVNGKYVGTCTDNIGRIKPYGARYGRCTISSARLERAWDRYTEGEADDFYPYATVGGTYRG